jgi:hypothetical protein
VTDKAAFAHCHTSLCERMYGGLAEQDGNCHKNGNLYREENRLVPIEAFSVLSVMSFLSVG